MGQQLIEYFPLNTLMLINGSFPMPVMITKKLFNAHHEKTTPTIQLKKKIRKFYHKRHFLFKKFDEGIVLDEESWYSVVPEEVASYVAERLHKRIIDQKIPIKQVIDGFCGSGGLAIQLASKFDNLLCIDLDPVKLKNLQANAVIYQRTIETQLNNFLLIEHEFDENTILTLCPPWGGLDYFKKEVYDLEKDMTPCLSDILRKAFSISCNIVLQLPKNVSISQLTTLIQQQSQHLNFKRYSLEIEMIYINNQISQLFVYFGQIVKCNYDAEIDCILKSQTHLDRKTIKEQGLIQTLQKLEIHDQVNLLKQ
ncbi:unnamed protein product [Paramecium octaurelia]|uniref:Trimethylguanosine synthase n=1 Tax=Paramecium octaurelia TaxID=43137 RepID=A0A8S1X0L9_PAROT|nr:unnamed protein product [Paramecium octaurelia]